MTQNKSFLQSVLGSSVIEFIGSAYIIIGGIVGSVSMCSTIIYYGFGPGAIWNIGFIPTIIGWVAGLFFSVLRVATWPYGLYVLINNPEDFFPWLFYLWYQ